MSGNYIFDANGTPVGFKYRGVDYASGTWDTYGFEKNLQGDIVAVYDAATGKKLIAYKYTAWGACTTSYYNSGSTTTATKNPFKYRGYYYDSNLGLYYLQSRYYDPVIGRFINADGYISTGQGIHSYNMYAYCNGNPVMYIDDSGNAPSHVMVSLYDGGGSTSNDGVTISRYSLSFGDIIILQGGGIDDKTKEMYAAKYPNCIIVTDGRFCNDDCEKCNPNMQIYNSYMITDTSQQKEILQVLYRYDKTNPSRHAWGRTIDSMMIEWDAHNDIHSITKHERVAHTDFDKNDENTRYIEYWIRAGVAGIGMIIDCLGGLLD